MRHWFRLVLLAALAGCAVRSASAQAQQPQVSSPAWLGIRYDTGPSNARGAARACGRRETDGDAVQLSGGIGGFGYGDVITGLDGVAIRSGSDLSATLARKLPGGEGSSSISCATAGGRSWRSFWRRDPRPRNPARPRSTWRAPTPGCKAARPRPASPTPIAPSISTAAAWLCWSGVAFCLSVPGVGKRQSSTSAGSRPMLPIGDRPSMR